MNPIIAAQYGTGGNTLAQATGNPGPQPGAGASSPIASFTTGITAGAIPQGQIDQSAQSMLAVPQLGGALSGALGEQFSGLMRQSGMGASVDMQRQAAQQQANLELQRQIQNANAGIAQSALMSRLNQDEFAQQNTMRQLMLGMLGGSVNNGLSSILGAFS